MVPTTAKNMINITDQMSNLADRTDIQRSWRRKPVIKDSYKLKKSEWYEKEKTKEKVHNCINGAGDWGSCGNAQQPFEYQL